MPPGFGYLASAELSDVGRKRKNNEDSVLSMPGHGVFCVADGMGGGEAGEVASGMVVDTLRKVITGAPDAATQSVPAKSRLVRGALQEAGRNIWHHAKDSGMRGCGTTAVAIIFDPERQRRAMTLHVGDSRAYRFRNGGIQQLTTDHSFAAVTGVADERMLPARFRSIITRAVGIAEQVLVDETPVEAEANDIYVLCSDGLSRMVQDEDIAKLIGEHKDESPAKLAELLVGAANAAGGQDNVTVVVVKLGALEGGPALSPGDVADATASGHETQSIDDDSEATQTHTLGLPGGSFISRGLTRRGKIGLGIGIFVLFIALLFAMEWYAEKHGMGLFRPLGDSDEDARMWHGLLKGKSGKTAELDEPAPPTSESNRVPAPTPGPSEAPWEESRNE